MIAARNAERWPASVRRPRPSILPTYRETTGPELWTDTAGGIDILVGGERDATAIQTCARASIWPVHEAAGLLRAGVGTGGTMTGCAQYIKPLKPSCKFVALEPVPEPEPYPSPYP